VTTGTTATTAAATTSAPAAGGSGFPTPEDCLTYNPANLSRRYEAGVWVVAENGSREIVRVYGGPSDQQGDQALAVAKRYQKVCFIGRGNHRSEKEAYIYEYWRNPSGQTPAIPGGDDLCSPYNRNNLTVEDMGDGDGWRVKDHDHVLQLFDNGTDANNGKLVLAHYDQQCSIGSDTPSGVQADITFTL
jgi:hypothetical protein